MCLSTSQTPGRRYALLARGLHQSEWGHLDCRTGALYGVSLTTRRIDKLRNRNHHLFDDRTFARVRRRLSAYKRDVSEVAEHHSAWPEVIDKLRRVRRRSKGWRPAHRGFRTLGASIGRSHERGRKAMEQARKRGRAEDYHEWRKEMKALWYELRLLEECSPSIKHDVSMLHHAETWLGDEHNLVVLCAELSKNASICNGIVDLSRLRLTVNRYQCDLRDKAIAIVETIYRRKSGAYVRALKRAWKAWRKQGRHAAATRAAAA